MGFSLPSSDAVVPSQEQKKKVLLVDDVRLFIELEKTFFCRKEAIEVLTACNGQEALAIAEAERPDIIFMDLHMPQMDGDECCRIIKNSDYGRDITIVMVTSAGRVEDSERCLAAGCDEILTKPINRLLFLSLAKKYLGVFDRKEPRYAVHVKVKYGENMDNLLTDYTVNLNPGGLFLSTSKVLPVNSELSLLFSLSEEEATVCCRARVAWVNDGANPTKRDLPSGMGFQFVDVSADQVEIIEQYIRLNALTAEW